MGLSQKTERALCNVPPSPCVPQLAATDPSAAADLFTDLANKENPSMEQLDGAFVRDSAKCAPCLRSRRLFCSLRSSLLGADAPSLLLPLPLPLASRTPCTVIVSAVSARWYADKKVFLDAEGNWGRMSAERWSKWLDWLHANRARGGRFTTHLVCCAPGRWLCPLSPPSESTLPPTHRHPAIAAPTELLTTAMQSRNPDGKDLVSLDDLRQGKAGEVRRHARGQRASDAFVFRRGDEESAVSCGCHRFLLTHIHQTFYTARTVVSFPPPAPAAAPPA